MCLATSLQQLLDLEIKHSFYKGLKRAAVKIMDLGQHTLYHVAGLSAGANSCHPAVTSDGCANQGSQLGFG